MNPSCYSVGSSQIFLAVEEPLRSDVVRPILHVRRSSLLRPLALGFAASLRR
jgi:hypothetical protein